MSREEFFVSGDGAPAMVLLPGWATDGRVFAGLFPRATTATTGPLRPEGFSRRLAAFLDRSGARAPVTLVGGSLGPLGIPIEPLGRVADDLERPLLGEPPAVLPRQLVAVAAGQTASGSSKSATRTA